MNHTKKILFISCLILLVLLALLIPQSKHTKRYAVFAGYNPDKTIHPYIITYLKGLKEVTDGIVYIADSELDPKEYKKLKGLVLHTEHTRHNEYDFGSYKRGFNWLKKQGYLNKTDELIFANDSSYAPMQSFKPMFATMAQKKDLDFWGNTQNSRFNPHLQSYFMVFRKKVLRSKNFAHFINQIKHQEISSNYILKYEVTLTPYLESLGYRWNSYIPYQEFQQFDLPDNNSYPLTLISKYNNQFLKRRTFTAQLDIRENTQDLLRYIHKHYPLRYQEIIAEIDSRFIPKDIKE